MGFGNDETSKQFSWIFRRAESKQLSYLPVILGSVAVVVVVVVIALVLYYKGKPQAQSKPRNTVASRGNLLATNKPRI